MRWKILPDPNKRGLHPCHDHRYIATEDASWEEGRWPGEWQLENGSIICTMTDTSIWNTRLVAAAPELLEFIKDWAGDPPLCHHGTAAPDCDCWPCQQGRRAQELISRCEL